VSLKKRLLAGVGTVAIAGSIFAVAAPAVNADVTNGPTVVGSCGGSVSLGKITTPVLGVGLGDQTGPVVVSLALSTDTISKTKIGGSCSTLVGPLTPKADAAKLSGRASCASGAAAIAADATAATAYPLNGKVTYTMVQTDPATTKPYVIQNYVSLLGFNTDPGHNGGLGGDVVDVGGIVIKGVGVGATTVGTIWEDPVAKLAKTDPAQPGAYNTGYALDLAGAAGCADATPNNANITLVLSGGGGASSTSLLGDTGGGVNFSFSESASLATP